jgi:hypothetical protein
MASVKRASEETLARVESEMLRRGLDRFLPQELNAAVFAFSLSSTDKRLHNYTTAHAEKGVKAVKSVKSGRRWAGAIWDAIDAEALRRTISSSNASSSMPPPLSASAPGTRKQDGTLLVSPVSAAALEEEWDAAWGAEVDDEHGYVEQVDQVHEHRHHTPPISSNKHHGQDDSETALRVPKRQDLTHYMSIDYLRERP